MKDLKLSTERQLQGTRPKEGANGLLGQTADGPTYEETDRRLVRMERKEPLGRIEEGEENCYIVCVTRILCRCI